MAKPRITIVGLGLIGGSLGLALHRLRGDYEIIGHDREHAIAGKAQKLGAIDKAEWNLISACEDADVVIIATPVRAVKEVFTAIAPYVKAECIISDTASTKAQVMAWAEEILPREVYFVGGDPMVGKGESGIEAATADLFKGAVYCLTPTAYTSPDAVKLLTDMVSSIGAKPYFLDAAEHDGLVAGVAHLPFVLSLALLDSTTGSVAWREMSRLAGHTFRMATQCATGDPATYRDACLTNATNIVRWIDNCIEALQRLRDTVASEDAEELENTFTAAIEARERWMRGEGLEEGIGTTEALQEARRFGLRQFFLGGR